MPMAKDIFIGIIILAILVQRQLVPRPLSGRLLVLPVILALYSLYEAVGQPSIQLTGWISLILTFLLSFIVGLIRGRMTRVYQENGLWMVSGSWWILLFWLLSIPIRYGLSFLLVPLLGAGAAFHGSLTTIPILFSVCGLVLGRAVLLTLRHPVAVREARMSHLAARSERRRRRI
ncbi:hypothetical protein [Alicyclobacillus sp. ALC3]|uniref:hypothetical protein n=1 Tax=Alicyclobacillus sp. ALC3 TaxID=2796143 RepID=UPI00237888A0|nr:hypothetical protein [Alicyclobacillus sp. ALC3]WDL97610.1 hypothetical protein JC200_02440 [Alicyclobacillus sp. ALC3]